MTLTGFVDQTEKLVERLSGDANLSKPGQVATFFYYRAMGLNNTEIASKMGVDRTTLNNWDNKLHENLDDHKYNDLVVNAVAVEHAKREEKRNE